MALATVANVNSDVGSLLGDPALEKYTAAIQLPFFGMAFRTVWDLAMNWDLPMVNLEREYTLPGGTTSLTPATAGIADMGEPQRLWERADGSSDDYILMEPKGDITNIGESDSLGFWKWEGDTFYFPSATSNRQIKIEYSSSGAAPTSGNIPIDNARTVLGFLTAAYLAESPICGQPSLAATLRRNAYGPTMEPDGTGGALRLLLNPMVKEKQKRGVVPPRFRPRRPRL
jgi:hypothetical protein